METITNNLVGSEKMRVSTSDSATHPLVTAPLKTADVESCKTVAVLEELLAQSIHLRDLYKHARCQTSDIQFFRVRQLFDAHYRGQLRLVDVLIDRMRTLAGASGVLAGDLLIGTHFSLSIRGRASIARVLRELLEVHELVLSTALPTGTNDALSDQSWNRDFAVGQVVLTNDLQRSAVSEHLTDRDITKTLLQGEDTANDH
jgi:starvation-inducible DNA-binding protein